MIIEIEGGKKLEVPDGSTPEQIDEVIGHFSQSAPSPAVAPSIAPGLAKTVFDQGMQGATAGFADEITDRLGAGIATLATDQKYSDLLKEARSSTKAELANQMEQRLVVSIGSQIAGGLLTGGAIGATKPGAAISNSIRSGLVPGGSLAARAANIVSKAGQGAVVGAASGGLYGAGTADEGERYDSAKSGAISGAIIGGAIPVAGAALGPVANAVIPKADEGLVEVGKIAQKYNIPVSVDELTSSKTVKNLQKISQELPLSGQSGFRDKQMKAFNRAITNSFGQNSDRITPEVMDKAFTEVGKEFDKLGRGKTFQFDDAFARRLDTIRQEATETASKDAIDNFNKAVETVFKNADGTGSISGEKLSFLRSRTNALARKANNPDTKELLHDLENALIDTMTAGDDAAKQALSDAKYKYKNLLVIEPLAQKGKGGNISPALLNNRVIKIYGRDQTRGKAGELGDLARVANELLPELGGSDTAQKGAYMLGTAAALSNPVTATKAATALGVNRALQSGVNRNQKVVNKMLKDGEKKKLPPPEKKKRITPPLTSE